MFVSPSKILLLILVVFAVWYATRWVNRPPTKIVRRRQQAQQQKQSAIEDLVACRTCGAYVAASAHHCGKPGCPLPR